MAHLTAFTVILFSFSSFPLLGLQISPVCFSWREMKCKDIPLKCFSWREMKCKDIPLKCNNMWWKTLKLGLTLFRIYQEIKYRHAFQ